MVQQFGPEGPGSPSPQDATLSALIQRIDDLDRDIDSAFQGSSEQTSTAQAQLTEQGPQLIEAGRRLILAGQRLVAAADPRGDGKHFATTGSEPTDYNRADQTERAVVDARAEAERIRAEARREAELMLEDVGEHLADMAATYQEAVRDARLTVHRMVDAVRRPIESGSEPAGG